MLNYIPIQLLTRLFVELIALKRMLVSHVTRLETQTPRSDSIKTTQLAQDAKPEPVLT